MISTNDRKTITAIAGAQTLFEFDFYVIDEDFIEVYYTDSDGYDWKLTKDSDYTVQDVDGDEFADGGQVTIISPPTGYSSGYLTIIGHADRNQEIDFINNQATDRQVYEASLDKLTMLVQELQAKIDRAVLMPVTEDGEKIPPKDERANNYLGWNSLGEIIAAKYVDSVPVTPFAQTLLDDSTAGAALSTLGVSAFIQTLLDDADQEAAQVTLGLDEIGIDWDSTRTYAADEIVAHDGMLWKSLQNSNTNNEPAIGSSWWSPATADPTGAIDAQFHINSQTITVDYTIPSGKNAMTAGPVEIDDGVTVTVSDGSVWVVV